MDFITPKTDWEKGDPVNVVDYNRINNNSQCIYAKLLDVFPSAPSITFGGDKDVEDWYYADEFTLFETVLANIETATGLDFGNNITFYDNGLFIGADELNRIESAHLEANDFLDMIIKMRYHLAFRLGAKPGTIRC